MKSLHWLILICFATTPLVAEQTKPPAKKEEKYSKQRLKMLGFCALIFIGGMIAAKSGKGKKP